MNNIMSSMATLKHFSLASIIMLLSIAHVHSQGCSDAGFCTIESFQPINLPGMLKDLDSEVKVGVSFGNADRSITAISAYLEFDHQFSDKFSANFKMTGLGQNGNDVSVYGLSDLFLTGNYNVSKSLQLTGGLKIPLTDANRMENGLPLPMDYQSSLGTFDLILGAGYSIGNLQTVLAWQQPLSQNNNAFLASEYPQDDPLSDFQSTNQYERKGDLMLRVSYPVLLGKKIVLTPSVLPIIHLGNDSYTNEAGREIEIEGSSGLTLNVNGYLDYSLSLRSTLQLNFGLPLVVRDSRPDGLTRSFVLAIEYGWRF